MRLRCYWYKITKGGDKSRKRTAGFGVSLRTSTPPAPRSSVPLSYRRYRSAHETFQRSRRSQSAPLASAPAPWCTSQKDAAQLGRTVSY